jgi:hypothetical protein
MYTLQMLQAIAPLIGGLCVDNYLYMQGDLCNFRQPPDYVLKYDKQDPKDACYKDGIYYPRCKDLENPEVWHYHQLLKNH